MQQAPEIFKPSKGRISRDFRPFMCKITFLAMVNFPDRKAREPTDC